ncbi:hypothetical protein VZT92_007828 [Zoarces viviparus]|uniref:Uncharacterized protein n=1 Tax=Zoarces viviparus TaxID=48416 RepID=A0AAW1FLF8_ZOAVI
MADGGSDDDVIHLVSFNLHGSRTRKWELITISDDSDEDTRIPGSLVSVPDDADDDDANILKPLTPARRRVIRPAAKWSRASHNLNQVVGHSSATSRVPTGDPSSAPSTSRDAKANSPAVRPAIRTPVQSGHHE